MASNDELAVPESTNSVPAQGLTATKQRRPQRSCDFCRHRKTRCDGPQVESDGQCSNCVAFGSTCTYLQPARKRGRKNITAEDLQKENCELKEENASLKAKLQSSLCSACCQVLQFRQSEGDDTPFTSPESDSSSSDPEEPLRDLDCASANLSSRFSQVSIDSTRITYLGPVSSFALADNVMAIKEKYMGRSSLTHARRALFWEILPWERQTYDLRPCYVYPANDLIISLLDLYFTTVHPTIPILHRPSFERSVAEGLHLTDTDFGGTLLSVLAVASRYSHDPRVFVDGITPLSSGWKFASQVRILPKLSPPTIHEVQMYCLLTYFFVGTSATQVAMLYMGLGFRSLRQRGVHRKKPDDNQAPNLENELWKRTFWIFATLEKTVSLCIGRPAGLHADDYDLALPLQVDDDHWGQGFTQPPGKPSQLSYFVFHLRVFEIYRDVLRRLHDPSKSKAPSLNAPDWEQRTVSDFNAAMNDFLTSLPPHLRWDPENPPEGTFFDQSATLHMSYNYILLSIHRPYIKNLIITGSLSFCASAARAIIHTADIWLRKIQRIPLPSLINPVFTSGIILVFNMLQNKRAGLLMGQNEDLVQLATAMEILKFSESRLQPVGRLWELLRELWFMDGPLQLPPTFAPPNHDLPGFIDGDASTDAVPPPHPPSFLGNVPNEYHPLHNQSFDTLSSEPNYSPALRPGMSIEELLASNGEPSSLLDDELMSMWIAAPMDIEDLGAWNAYIESRNIYGGDGN
ncbi:fungal-specific transcription factor domain-containing protein [Mycena albidolilacea]|uniref:Fungal-specific transcription factor domain-containing protein n=1 Tax=Mycena albidolilacea TaxID=1033008 RepID=A0AAD7APW2_9AGAR|nr:fungal-specific transcription factor domain-containing protein [Mycena albidolilacea]